MRRLILSLAFLGMTGIAHAEDTYIYDLLKNPVHARSWKTLTSAKKTPAWVRDENRYIAGSLKTISIDSADYQISVIAKQHATNDGQAAVLFNMDGTQAWAEVQDDGKPALYLGEPSVAQKAALDKALAE
ncbi:Ivy family c-type lysozyme inhibitor [Rhizobium sp. No.120]